MTGGPDAALASFLSAQKFGCTLRDRATPKKLRRAEAHRGALRSLPGTMLKNWDSPTCRTYGVRKQRKVNSVTSKMPRTSDTSWWDLPELNKRHRFTIAMTSRSFRKLCESIPPPILVLSQHLLSCCWFEITCRGIIAAARTPRTKKRWFNCASEIIVLYSTFQAVQFCFVKRIIRLSQHVVFVLKCPSKRMKRSFIDETNFSEGGHARINAE